MDLLAPPNLSRFLNNSERIKLANKLMATKRHVYKDVNILDTNGDLFFLPTSFTIPQRYMLADNKLLPIVMLGTLVNGERAAVFLSDTRLFFIDVIILNRDWIVTMSVIDEHCVGVLETKQMCGHYINEGYIGRNTKWVRVYFTSIHNRAQSIVNLRSQENHGVVVGSNITSSNLNKDIMMVLSKNNITSANWMRIKNYASVPADRRYTIYDHEYTVTNYDCISGIDAEECAALNLPYNSYVFTYDIECAARNVSGGFANPNNKEDVITAISIHVGTEDGRELAGYVLALAPIVKAIDYAKIYAFDNECDLLKAFFYLYYKWQPEWLVDFNGLSFDQRWILLRALETYELNDYLLRAYSVWRNGFISPTFVPKGGIGILTHIKRQVKLEKDQQQTSYVLKAEGGTYLDMFLYLRHTTQTLDLPNRQLNSYLNYYNIALKDQMTHAVICEVFERIIAIVAIMRVSTHENISIMYDRFRNTDLFFLAGDKYNHDKYPSIDAIVDHITQVRNIEIHKNVTQDVSHKYTELFDNMRALSPQFTPEHIIDAVLEENDMVLHYNFRDTQTLYLLCVKLNAFKNLRIQATFNFVTVFNMAISGETLPVIFKQFNWMEKLHMTSRELSHDLHRKREIHESINKTGGKVFPIYYPRNGVITDPVITIDVKSFYPSIQQAFDISPETYMPGPAGRHKVGEHNTIEIITLNRNIGMSDDDESQYMFSADNPNYISTFVRTGNSLCNVIQTKNKEHRNEVKKKMKAIAKDPNMRFLYDTYDQIQKSIKINANSTYGFNSSIMMAENGAHSVFVATAITTIAAALITHVAIFVFENFGGVIVGGDTDSIFIMLPRYMYERYYSRAYIDILENDHDLLYNLGYVFGEIINSHVNKFLASITGVNSIEMELDDIPVALPTVLMKKRIYLMQGQAMCLKTVRDRITREVKTISQHVIKERGISNRRRGTTELESYFVNDIKNGIMVYRDDIDVKTVVMDCMRAYYMSDISVDLVKRSMMLRVDKDNKQVAAFVKRMEIMNKMSNDKGTYLVPRPNERFETASVFQGKNKFTLAGTSKPLPESDKIEYVHVIKKYNLQLDKNHYIFGVLSSRASQFLHHKYPDMKIEAVKKTINRELQEELLRSNDYSPASNEKMSKVERTLIIDALKRVVLTRLETKDFLDFETVLFRERFLSETYATFEMFVCAKRNDTCLPPDEYLRYTSMSRKDLFRVYSEMLKQNRNVIRSIEGSLSSLFYMLEYKINDIVRRCMWNVEDIVNKIDTSFVDDNVLFATANIIDNINKREVFSYLCQFAAIKALMESTV